MFNIKIYFVGILTLALKLAVVSCQRGGGDFIEPSRNQFNPISTGSCFQIGFGDNAFTAIAPRSKYLYNPKATFVSIEEAAIVCNAAGLELADINNAAEWKYVTDFILSNPTFTDRKWALGMRKTKKGYVTSSGRPIKYQQFWVDNYASMSGNCVCIGMSISEHLAMLHVNCDTITFPFCQFREHDKCSKNAVQLADEEREDTLIQIDSTLRRYYFVGSKQKMWRGAEKMCGTNGKQMLDFTNPYESLEVGNIVRKYLSMNDMHESIGFWTSGRYFVDNFNGVASFLWSNSGQTAWVRNRTLPWYAWAPGEPRGGGPKSPNHCVVMYSLNKIPELAIVNCNVPQYFICFEPVNKLPPIVKDVELALISGREKPGEGKRGKKPQAPCPVKDPPKINLTSIATNLSEIFTLLNYTIKNSLQEDYVEVKLKPQSDWRRPIVMALNRITKHLCDGAYVSRKFVNSMSNMMLIYYNSIAWNATVDDVVWADYLDTINKCAETSEPLPLAGNGEVVFSHAPPMDMIDVQHQGTTDMVIDAFWYMFSISAGACFPPGESASSLNTVWMTQYFHNFNKDFLKELIQRWEFPGHIPFNAFLGDIEFGRQMYNLRACSAAAYQSHDLLDFHFVRPILLSKEWPIVENYNTGDNLVYAEQY